MRYHFSAIVFLAVWSALLYGEPGSFITTVHTLDEFDTVIYKHEWSLVYCYRMPAKDDPCYQDRLKHIDAYRQLVSASARAFDRENNLDIAVVLVDGAQDDLSIIAARYHLPCDDMVVLLRDGVACLRRLRAPFKMRSLYRYLDTWIIDPRVVKKRRSNPMVFDPYQQALRTDSGSDGTCSGGKGPVFISYRPYWNFACPVWWDWTYPDYYGGGGGGWGGGCGWPGYGGGGYGACYGSGGCASFGMGFSIGC